MEERKKEFKAPHQKEKGASIFEWFLFTTSPPLFLPPCLQAVFAQSLAGKRGELGRSEGFSVHFKCPPPPKATRKEEEEVVFARRHHLISLSNFGGATEISKSSFGGVFFASLYIG